MRFLTENPQKKLPSGYSTTKNRHPKSHSCDKTDGQERF
jgi:hypothetical protein